MFKKHVKEFLRNSKGPQEALWNVRDWEKRQKHFFCYAGEVILKTGQLAPPSRDHYLLRTKFIL
jgi:hypothetical protein